MEDLDLCIAERDRPPDFGPLPSVSGDTNERASTPPSPAEDLQDFNPGQDLPAEEFYFMRRRRYDALLHYYQGRKGRRPDLSAMQRMTRDKQVCTWKGAGNVGGAVVGDTFRYRAEMKVLGLHREVEGGISSSRIGGQRLGVSVVASGGYEDDEDYGEVLLYSGHGGRDKVTRRQAKDQLPEKGNLALMSCCENQDVVRVIRGHISRENSRAKTIYSYDGLYNVLSYRREVGRSGYVVYMFKLERCPGQLPLPTPGRTMTVISNGEG